MNVPFSVLEKHGEVSLETALAMATGAKNALDCDWALSITGIAGPNGGTVENPVGTVCFALVGPNFEEVKKENFNHTKREQVQQASVICALEMLIEGIK